MHKSSPSWDVKNQFYSGVGERELVKQTAGSSLLWEEDPRVSKGRSSDLSFAFWSNLSARLSGRSLLLNLPKLLNAPCRAPHLLYFIAAAHCDTES